MCMCVCIHVCVHVCMIACVCVQGEKLLLLIHEEELLQEDLLVFLTEFVVSCTISPLFTYEEQTTIINSIRTEVTQAGLTYTRDVAWNFFLR